jgi:phosphate transport system substrate-binding protein
MSTVPRYVFLGLVVVVVGALVAMALQSQHDKVPEPDLQGAGSTFVNPLMVQWASRYEGTESGCRVGYRSLGSGAGIKLLTERQVDFGCTDGPMTDAQLAGARAAGGEVLHIPLVLGAVVPAYNLPGLGTPLRFTGPVLADIYLGKIKKWNHPALRDLNPGVELPELPIRVVHRADGSGTTYIWTDYLTKVSAEWKKAAGTGILVTWPTGTAAQGNEGVADKVQKTRGSIGYVELTYAYQLDLAFGLVQNREKEFVRASLAAVTKAADNALRDIPDDLRYSMTDAPGKGSYPIAGTTWAIVFARQPAVKGGRLVSFLQWATDAGQRQVEDLLYARLPEALAERARAAVEKIQLGER